MLIEFALVLSAFLMLFFGILEYSLMTYTSIVMENAVVDAARFGMTGQEVAGQTREQYIRKLVLKQTDSLPFHENILVTTTVFKSFAELGALEPYKDLNRNRAYDEGEPFTDSNGNNKWDRDTGSLGLGGPGDVVVYKISYPWKIMTPVASQLFGTDGIFDMTTYTVIRNEPYALASR